MSLPDKCPTCGAETVSVVIEKTPWEWLLYKVVFFSCRGYHHHLEDKAGDTLIEHFCPAALRDEIEQLKMFHKAKEKAATDLATDAILREKAETERAEKAEKERDELKAMIKKIAGKACNQCVLCDHEWSYCRLFPDGNTPSTGRRRNCPLLPFLKEEI